MASTKTYKMLGLSEESSATARRLVVAAERVIAVHGIEGSSLRQIALEAGASNHSAVNYHFESKSGLIRAVLGYRIPKIVHERRVLQRHCDGGDLRGRLEAHLLPLFQLAESRDNRYVTVLEHAQRHEMREAYLSGLPMEFQTSNADFRRDVQRLLKECPKPIRTLRIAEAQSVSLHAAVDRDCSVAFGKSVVDFDLFVSAQLDGLVAGLEAPLSRSTLAKGSRLFAKAARRAGQL
jgi:AcrR family transcriptional regulator